MSGDWQPTRPRKPNPFLGGAMIAVGAIIVGLCGACTLNVARSGGGYGMEYIVGGVPILLGGLLMVRGCLDLLALRRTVPPPKGPPE